MIEDKFIKDTPFGKLMQTEVTTPFSSCIRCKYLNLDNCADKTNRLCVTEGDYLYFQKDETNDFRNI